MTDDNSIDISKTIEEQLAKIIKTQKDNDNLVESFIKDSKDHLESIQKDNDIFKGR